MAEKLIYDIVKGKDTLTPGLKNSEKAAAQLSSSISKIGAGVATFFAAKFSIQGLKRTIAEAVELENALIGLRSVTSATGNSVSFITEEAKKLAADGLIPLAQVSNSLKNLLATGLDGQKAVEVFKALRDSASFNRQGQLELGEAVQAAAEGLKNDLSIKIDNAGITKNLSNIQKEYAASIGKTIGQLTEQERTQAKYVGILKEAGIFQGDYNRLLNTYSGATSEAEGSTKFLLAEIGGLITNSPKVVRGIRDISLGIRNLTQTLSDNAPAISSVVGKIADILVITPTKFWLDLFTNGASGARGVGDLTRELESLEKQADSIQKVIQDNKDNSIYNSFLGRKDDDIKRLAEVFDNIAEVRARIDEANKSTELAQTETKAVAAEDDGRVLRELAVADLLNDLRTQQSEKQAELELLQNEAEGLKTEEKLINLQSQFEAENDIRLLAAEEEKALKIKTDKDLADLEKVGFQRRLKDRLNSAKAEVDLERKTTGAKIGLAQAAADLGAAIAGENNKAIFLAQKAISAAQIFISGQAAEAAALAPPPIGAGPIAGVGLAGLIRAKTVLSLASVAATSIKGFQNGGLLSDGTRSGDNVVFSGNRDEAVFTRAQQAELFAIASGKSAENTNQNQQNQNGDIVVMIGEREIARAVRNQIQEGFKIA